MGSVIGAYGDRQIQVYTDGGIITLIRDLGPATLTMPRIMPGMVDLHVHSRQPGGDGKEDWPHLFQAAMRGGVTTVVTMPNTSPPIASLEVLEQARKLAGDSPLRPLFWFGVTPDNLDQMDQAVQEPDVVGLKLYTGSTTNALVVSDPVVQEQALRLAARRHLPVAAHCVDDAVVGRNLELLGHDADFADHPIIRDVESQLAPVKRILQLAKRTGCEVLFCHVSTLAAAEAIRQYQRSGGLAWIEFCPHYLFLDSSLLRTTEAWRFKMNPALRSRSETEQLWQFFLADQADTIGSDHAPHTIAEKTSGSYADCPSGVPGLQTTLPLLNDRVWRGELSQRLLVEYTSARPAQIIGLSNKGRIARGAAADLVLVDPTQQTVLEDEAMFYQCGWTPYKGRILRGRIVSTILGGSHYDV